jgi:tetratricopeptide (TPR) repeat protein
MLTTLILKRAPEALRPACAWFLPGAEPREWLATLALWPVRTESFRLYPIAEPTGARPLGVLVVSAEPLCLPAGARALPYGTVTDGFYVPVDGLLFPPLAPAELRELMRHPVQVWHPVAGLSGFDAADARRVADLLLAPVSCDERWNLARGVEPANARLRSVRLRVVLSLEDLFGAESADIGSEPLADLPPSKDGKPSRLPPQLTEGLLLAGALGARGIVALLALVPRGSGPATWVNHLENWVRQKFEGVNADLEKQRNRELHRLLEMLEKDPANALKHAISLADLANRGRAPSSGRLGERSTDFDLKRLGGGRAADGWAVPPDIRTSLTTRYREAAQREAALGNFRRAACIFAELLGDYSAAADMLKRGRFFLEAAVLYRERLRNEAAEAECLAEGGFFDEAIAIHERRARWLEVAALYEKSDRPEAAREALRRAVGVHVAAGDFLAAARLTEVRLNEVEEALRLLASTWPGGKQAFLCLEERFALLGRREDHVAIQALIGEFTRSAPPAALTVSVIGLLTRLAETMVHEPGRRAASEAVRVRAAGVLGARGLDGADEMAVLRALTRLEPQDRVLKRDVLRYREIRIQAATTPPVLPKVSPGMVRRVLPGKMGTLTLPKVGPWLSITASPVANGHEIHAIARSGERRVFFTRGTWAGAMQSADWSDPAPELGAAFLLARRGAELVLARPGVASLAQQELPASDFFKDGLCRVGTPSWLPEDAVRIAASRAAFWVVRLVAGRVVLASYAEGGLVYSRDVTDELMAAGASGEGGALAIEANGGDGRLALGYGRHLLVLDGGRKIEVRDLGAGVLGLLAAPPGRPGWIALLERGAVFVCAHTLEISEVDGQMVAPRGVFLGDGHLVLLSEREGRVIAVTDEVLAATAWFPFDGGDVFALLASAHPREFTVFTAQGVGQRWQLPI